LQKQERDDLLEDLEGQEWTCGLRDIRDWTMHLSRKKRSGNKTGIKNSKVELVLFTHPGLHCRTMLEPHFYKYVFSNAMAQASALIIGNNINGDRLAQYSRCVYCSVSVNSFKLDDKKQPAVLPLCDACKTKGLPSVQAKSKLQLAAEVPKEK
jgi:hypothetical protein